MEAEIEKRAEELGVDTNDYKFASILEGLALHSFHDEVKKLAKEEDKKDDMKKEDKKEENKEEKKENDKNGEKENEDKDEKNMSKKERFLAMIKKKKEGKSEGKEEQKKESSFASGFKEEFEKNASIGGAVKKVAPYLLGGAGLATGAYALHKQKKETVATRSALQGLAAGTGRALQGVSMRQKWNDMRDQINEGRLKRGVNVNRQAILQILRSQGSGK